MQGATQRPEDKAQGTGDEDAEQRPLVRIGHQDDGPEEASAKPIPPVANPPTNRELMRPLCSVSVCVHTYRPAAHRTGLASRARWDSESRAS